VKPVTRKHDPDRHLSILRIYNNDRQGYAMASPPYSLLEWATENIASMRYEAHPIADTGDYSEQFHVVDHDGRESWGESYADAIEQAQMDENDKRRMDYVPPEFR
jgi:hypothetical protein